MANRLTHTDLVIGAAGMTALERCAIGTPSLIYLYAENQRQIANYIAQQGAAEIFADQQAKDLSALSNWFTQTSSLPKPLSAMSAAALTLCDAKGAARVAAAMLTSTHHLAREHTR